MKTFIRWLILFSIMMVGAFLGAGLSRALMVKGLESSEVAGWVQAIGATIGIGIAIWVPHQQQRNALREGRIRSFHHALAVVNDLRSRVAYTKSTMRNGGRPLVALTSNIEMLKLRYEALYDRDLYAHLPGPTINQITEMSGSFAGIEMAAALTAARLGNKPEQIIPAWVGPTPDPDPIEQLFQDLDRLFTSLETEAKATHHL